MKLNYLFVFLLFGSLELSAQIADTAQVYLADPTIFKDKGEYYLYGTREDPTIKGEGFLVYSSRDNKHWKGPIGVKDGFALKKGDAFGTRDFWAPQVFKYHSKYYIAYAANEKIAIASSDSPLGPFRNNMKPLQASVKQIDPFVFFDNGKFYLYHVRLQNGNRIFVAEMNEDLQSIKPETLKECLHSEEKWENTENREWTVSEGPSVFKNDGLYYLLYSANDFRNPNYAVGYATAKSPMGPWKKSPNNPIISRKILNENGSGHGDISIDRNRQLQYVLHTHFSEDAVHPRKTGIINLYFIKDNQGKDILKIDKKTFRYLHQTY